MKTLFNDTYCITPHLDPLLLFHISLVCLSLVAFASILLIFTDTLNVVLVVITPAQQKERKHHTRGLLSALWLSSC